MGGSLDFSSSLNAFGSSTSFDTNNTFAPSSFGGGFGETGNSFAPTSSSGFASSFATSSFGGLIITDEPTTDEHKEEKKENEENLEDKKEEEMDSLSLLKLTTAQSFIDSLIFDLLTKVCAFLL